MELANGMNMSGGFDTVEALASGVTIANILSWGFLGIFLIFTALSALQGLRRGLKKQALHAICMFESAVLSYFIVRGITQAFVDGFDISTASDLLSSIGMNPELAGSLNGVNWFLAMPVGTMFVPGVFVTLYLLTTVGAGIMYRILKRVLEIPKKASGAERIPGLVVGAVEGMLCFSILVLPFAGILGLVDDGVETLRAKDNAAYEELLDAYDSSVGPLANNVAFKAIRGLGGDAVLDEFATFESDGREINMREEIISVVSMVAEIGSLGKVDFNNLTPDQQKVLNSAVETLGESDYLSSILSAMLRSMASAVKTGIIPFEMTPPFDMLIGDVVALFETSTRDNLKADILSVLEIYYIFCDNGVLDAMRGEGDLSDVFTKPVGDSDQTVINKVIDALRKNEHTRPLVSTLTRLSIALISSEIGLDEDATEIYENVKEGLKDVLKIDKSSYADTEEGKAQYKADLTSELDTTFKENGIELEADIVSGIADYIDENVDTKEEYTDEEINDVILSYYDAYLKYLENNGGEQPDNLEDLIPDTSDTSLDG